MCTSVWAMYRPLRMRLGHVVQLKLADRKECTVISQLWPFEVLFKI